MLIMRGGSSHQRKMSKKARERRANDVAELGATRISNAPKEPNIPRRNNPLSTDRVLGILAIILTTIGLRDMYPLWMNAGFLGMGLILSLWAISKWEGLKGRPPKKVLPVLLLVGLVYCAAFAYPMKQQYDRQTAIEITFKDSPLFTWWRQQVIRHDLAGFRAYLSELGIETPSTLPPLTISPNDNGGDVNEPGGLPEYRAEIGIGKLRVGNRMGMTFAYGDYVIHQKFSNSKLLQPFDVHNAFVATATIDPLNAYFNASYWGKPEKAFMGPLGETLWDIRSQFGRNFTDRLAAYTLMLIADSPEEDRDSQIDLEFWRKVRRADGLIESNANKWPQIVAILKKNGQPVDNL
jgi:hypothetical protein